jgi:hypothetical protein
MPERQTLQRARRDKRQGKATTTQAGEFIREEMHHIREGVNGARSARQAIAIGLSKARRAGVELKPPAPDQTSTKARRSAERDYERGQGAPSAHPTQSPTLAHLTQCPQARRICRPQSARDRFADAGGGE